MSRKKAPKNEKELYDRFINQLFPETIKGLEEGTIYGDEIVDREHLERFGSLFNRKYPQLRNLYDPVRDGALELHWIERNVFFNLGAAFNRRVAKEPKLDTLKGK